MCSTNSANILQATRRNSPSARPDDGAAAQTHGRAAGASHDFDPFGDLTDRIEPREPLHVCAHCGAEVPERHLFHASCVMCDDNPRCKQCRVDLIIEAAYAGGYVRADNTYWCPACFAAEYSVDENDIRERVERGAAWLDIHVPGWDARIDVDRLDIGNQDHCVLCQVFGFYGQWVTDSGNDALGFTWFSAGTPSFWGPAKLEVAALNAAWTDLILDRRSLSQGGCQ